MAGWSEQWTLRSKSEPPYVMTKGGPAIYGDQTVEVVPKLEAEQQIDNALKQGADQERQRFFALLDKEIVIAEAVSHRAHVNVLKSFQSAVLAANQEVPMPAKAPKEWPERLNLSALTNAFATFPDEREEDGAQSRRPYVRADIAAQAVLQAQAEDAQPERQRLKEALEKQIKLRIDGEERGQKAAKEIGSIEKSLGHNAAREAYESVLAVLEADRG
jgi:hypothetical protein